MDPLAVPTGLEAQRQLGPDWARWLDGLADRAAEVVEDWTLTRDGSPMHGFCSLVLPVRTTAGGPAVLKLTFDGDDESVHEGLALQHWHGNGAVSLLRADPHRRALLLERLHTEDLTGLWDIEACEIVAGLYARLHIPAMPQLRPLTAYVEGWLDDLARLPRDGPIPRRFVEQCLALGRDLVADRASTGSVVHGDLHYENVLDSDRGWLAIDPKPMSGDPHYEVAPLLWNRWEETRGDVRGVLRRRFHATIDAAGLEEDRARDWVVVRMILNASWAVADLDRGATDQQETKDWVTTCLAVAKGVQG